jgi:hypothetical protein
MAPGPSSPSRPTATAYWNYHLRQEALRNHHALPGRIPPHGLITAVAEEDWAEPGVRKNRTPFSGELTIVALSFGFVASMA